MTIHVCFIALVSGLSGDRLGSNLAARRPWVWLTDSANLPIQFRRRQVEGRCDLHGGTGCNGYDNGAA